MLQERQAAVEAVLSSGHIPAGMELFSAGDESQLEVIKRWIDESDVYLLILGGRYGTIEPKTGKSYIEIEYEYAAAQKKMPYFAVVINSSALNEKIRCYGKEASEIDNPGKYKEFRDLVTTKMCKFFDDAKDIKIAIHQTLSEYQAKYNLPGWVCGRDVENAEEFIKQNTQLLTDNQKLRRKLETVEKELSSRSKLINGYSYEEIKKALENIQITVNKEVAKQKADFKSNAFDVFIASKNNFAVGVTDAYGVSAYESFLFHTVAPNLMVFGLVDTEKVTGVRWQRVKTNKNGNLFLGQYEIERLSKKKS